jgi:hypothetical protein
VLFQQSRTSSRAADGDRRIAIRAADHHAAARRTD